MFNFAIARKCQNVDDNQKDGRYYHKVDRHINLHGDARMAQSRSRAVIWCKDKSGIYLTLCTVPIAAGVMHDYEKPFLFKIDYDGDAGQREQS
jgi:hypothetical protein